MEFLQKGLQNLSIQFLPFLIAVIVHEWGHGRMALKWGDTTARDEGRLTFDPIPHIDVIGTVVLPAMMFMTGSSFLFGWAKPVPIDPRRFTKYRPGLFWVSVAGVLMNSVVATLSAAIYIGARIWIPQSSPYYDPVSQMAMFSITINYALAVFNLLPIPPLDGSKVVESFLSYQAMQKYEQFARFGFLILLALMFTGALSILSIPIYFLSEITVRLVGALFYAFL
jgi:Zn-dependent protease